MNCYSELLSIVEYINSTHEYSYDYLEELKANKTLDKMFDSHNIEVLLKKELYDFLYLLDNTNFIYHEYLRKIYIHESEFIKIYIEFGYLLSLFLNNSKYYRVFPLFFKECVDHYNISNYSNKSLKEIEDLLYKYVDLKISYSYKYEKELVDVVNKTPELYTKYSKYDYKLNNKQILINCLDKDEFFVYSEFECYSRELDGLSRFNLSCPKDYVRWVSRYDGDGYGYDVLSYDIIKNREKVIEVKSGISERIDLTRVEYKTMLDTIKRPYSDYYIYKYYYNTETKYITLSMLKYDKNNHVFIDIITKEVYKLIPYFDFDENNTQRVKVDVVKEDKYNLYLNK